MKKIAVIYHSGQGNTEHFARLVVAGAQSVDETQVSLLKAADLAINPSGLLGFDGYILGSPTYLGGVSGPFKSFMDATACCGAHNSSRASWPPVSPSRPCPRVTSKVR